MRDTIDGLPQIGSVVILDLPKRIFLGVLVLVVQHFSIISTPSTAIEVNEKVRRIAFRIAGPVGLGNGVPKSRCNGIGSTTTVQRPLIVNRRTLGAVD